jgi:ornithine carbamoyltransferase
MRHLLDIFDLSREEIISVLDDAARWKATPRAKLPKPMAGKLLGLVFEKPSLRTRVSFEAAATRLGGSSLFMVGDEVGIGRRESVEDFARVISQYVDTLVMRVFAHSTVATVAAHATIPVINGLSDAAHPCQALADLLTIQEAFESVEGRTIAFIGDGNNVARSLARGCARLGTRFILARPAGYGFDIGFVRDIAAQCPGARIEQTADPAKAVSQADVIYTDVWTSMGQESERAKRHLEFKPYQVNAALMRKAPDHARVLHCLPAHRGEEITADVLEGPQSLVIQQAANRMNAQAALLMWLMR